MLKQLSAFIERLESRPIGLGLWFVSALSVIFIRNSIESLVDYHKFPDLTTFDLLHVPVFYLTVFLAVIVLLHLFSGTAIARVSRTCLMFFPVILFPVAVDFVSLVKSGGQASYNYIFEDAWPKFINFFNPFYPIPDVPGGLRLEIALIAILAGLYLFAKTGRVWRALAGGFCVFAACFGFGALPANIINVFNGIVYPLMKRFSGGFVGANMDENVIVIAQLSCLLALSGTWYFRHDAEKFRAIAGNLRWDRSLHYLLLAAFGLRLAQPAIEFSDLFISFKVCAMFASLFFAFQHAVVMNDIEDLDCDRITNRNRPLVRGVVSRGEFLTVGNVYLAFSLCFAAWVSPACFMIVLLYIAIAFVYSVPPLRLKKHLLLSVLILGAEALLAYLLGQASFSPPGEPLKINAAGAWLVFFMICLGESVKDLKDVEGDRATGVATLPVLLGEREARLIIGCLVAIGYLLTPIFLVPRYAHVLLTFFAFLFGGINLWYINRSDAQERDVFRLYFAYAAIIFLLLK